MLYKILKKIFSIKKPTLKKYFIYSIVFQENYLSNKVNENIEIFILENFNQIKDLKNNNYKIKDIDHTFFKIAFRNNCFVTLVFYSKILAHISWFTFDRKGKKIIDPITKFENETPTVYWGTAFTYPEYRSKGISKIAMKECLIYSNNMKFNNLLLSVRSSNLPAIRSYSYFSPNLNGIAYSLNILWYNFKYFISSKTKT